jgi:hypothetical protein
MLVEVFRLILNDFTFVEFGNFICGLSRAGTKCCQPNTRGFAFEVFMTVVKASYHVVYLMPLFSPTRLVPCALKW